MSESGSSPAGQPDSGSGGGGGVAAAGERTVAEPRRVRFVELVGGLAGCAAAGLGFAALGGWAGVVLIAALEAAMVAVLIRWSAWR